MTLGQIAAVVGGTVDQQHKGVVVSGDAFRDSRERVPSGLFVAVVGEHVDGHDYAERAIGQGGAAAVLAGRPVSVPAVVVDDVLEALGRLARHVVAQQTGLTVVGVTGSQGKTSTKDMLAEVLGAAGETVAPLESLNNELGLPLTALRVRPSTRYLVSEMGARGLGQIRYLADIVRPTVGAVLNVGVAHLGEFGSQDGIAAAKGELVEALPPHGLAVLNSDDRRVAAMSARTAARVITFGRSEAADVRITNVGIDGDGHTTLRLQYGERSTELTMRYVGEHQAMNAAAAAAVALGIGLDYDAVVESLRTAAPLSKWRMDIRTNPDGVVVINDSYNANPDSMRAGLRALVDIANRRGAARTFAVLGEMCELGDTSRSEHEAIGRLVAGLGIAEMVAVGEPARPLYVAATDDSSWGGVAHFAAEPGEAVDFLRGELRRGDVVLVKASRAAGLEGLAAALLAGAGPAPTTGTDGER